MRIWDLRRGDADDDRTSPHGRGLASLAVSAALEFNYLKAPVGFFVLFVVPALVIGLIPSVVLAYGRLMWRAPAAAGGGPIVAVVILAVLAALAWGAARFGFVKARDDFWQLHSGLVLPIFVVLRELLRAGVEKWRGGTMSAAELDRSRRVCAIVAALIFAGAGLGVVAIVDVSFGLRLVDVVHLRWRPVAAAALGNAAALLGLSAALESVYWIRRELSFDTRVADWSPDPAAPAAALVRIAHLSDLHVVGERYGHRMEAGSAGPRGNRAMRRALKRLSRIDAAAPLDRVVMTGDITDAGTRAEWAEFLDLLRGCPRLRRRLSLVPGNHDVNIIDRANPGRLDLPWSAGQALRKLRVVLALDALCGERCHVVDPGNGAIGPPLAEFLRQGRRPDRLRELAGRGAGRGRREMRRVWDAIFPLVEPPSTGQPYGVMLLDSNARSHFALTNAIGVIGPSQLKAVRMLLQNTRHPWLVLLHHQVVEYPSAAVSLRERIGLALVNAPQLLAALAPHWRRVVVLHGHRHRDWVGVCGQIVLCSAPSATLGGGGYGGSFRVHEIAVEDDRLRLVATERVGLSQRADAKFAVAGRAKQS